MQGRGILKAFDVILSCDFCSLMRYGFEIPLSFTHFLVFYLSDRWDYWHDGESHSMIAIE